MQNIRLLLASFFATVMLIAPALNAKAQGDENILKYVATFKDMAIAEMQRSGVPASITLAQGIHETSAGTSDLVLKSNNHFGIKCKANWTGPSVTHDDDLRNECFRKYENPADSYRDHSDFLKGSTRYSNLFQLDPLDYKDWAYGLKRAGYATNPKYPMIIIKLIEDYHLQDYSMIAIGQMQPGEEALAKATKQLMKEGDLVPVAAIQPPPPGPEMVEVVQEEAVNYPSGEFRINETRVVFAKKNTSLLSIAQQYGVQLARLIEFNEMDETETIDRDQLIFLQRKRKTGANEFHIVKPGETLADISDKEGIRLGSLCEYNFLNTESRPAVGEQLYLHKKAPAMPKLETRLASVNHGAIE